MIDLTFLSKNDVKRLNENIGFTDNELIILNNLVSEKFTDEGLMFEMHLNRNKYYKIKMNLLYKIIKFAAKIPPNQ